MKILVNKKQQNCHSMSFEFITRMVVCKIVKTSENKVFCFYEMLIKILKNIYMAIYLCTQFN